MTESEKNYAISGHETFAFRFAWIPKAVEGVLSDERLLLNDDEAMVRLGVGKNMVQSIRFWSFATGVIQSNSDGGHRLTEIGEHLFHPETGLDPFLEDDQTLWLLHWQLAHASRPLFAWDFLLNRWHEPELLPSAIIAAGKRFLSERGTKTSENSLRSHLSTFFHTYSPTRKNKGDSVETELDCPLVQLESLQHRGDRDTALGRKESAYSFRRGQKHEISDALFCYVLADFWRMAACDEVTISCREIANQAGSPGLVFKLEDQEIRERFEKVEKISGGMMTYVASSLVQSIHRNVDLGSDSLRQLREVIYA